jgi:hypothetical protein
MSIISFMRECISEPMNPGPLFIIRNNFPFTLSLFLFLVIIKIQKYFIYCISQTKTLQLYLLWFIIALHIALVCIFPRHRIFGAVAFAYLFILYCIFISIFVYLHTPCAWQPLGEVEGTKQIYFTLRVVRRGTGRILIHTVPREFDINPRVTFVGKIKLPYAQHSALGVST